MVTRQLHGATCILEELGTGTFPVQVHLLTGPQPMWFQNALSQTWNPMCMYPTRGPLHSSVCQGFRLLQNEGLTTCSGEAAQREGDSEWVEGVGRNMSLSRPETSGSEGGCGSAPLSFPRRTQGRAAPQTRVEKRMCTERRVTCVVAGRCALGRRVTAPGCVCRPFVHPATGRGVQQLGSQGCKHRPFL